VQLDLTGYALVFGAVRCVIVFGKHPGSEVLLDPAVAVYATEAPPVDVAGVSPVTMDCAGGVGRRDLGVLLEYSEQAHVENYGGSAGCALFAPCAVRVRFASSPSSTAAAIGLRPWIPGAIFVIGNSSIGPAEPQVQVTPLLHL
jgi:hypothetical protein